MKYILSIDQGTTGSTALILKSESLEVIAKSNHEFTQHFPKQSWVEHDLNEIWESVEKSVIEAIKIAKIQPSDISAIGITNQRETTCAFNKNGAPLAKAIVWQDRRTFEYCQNNLERYKPLVKKTGLPLDSYFSATKMKWLLDNNQEVQQAAKDNDLRFSTIDSYLLYRLTNGEVFSTDATNASRTLLMDLKSCDWDEELLRFFEIDRKFLPQVEATVHNYGKTKKCRFLPDDIPIMCMIGDQQSALLGQMGVKPGEMKCTYGTGAFLLLNTGEDIIYSDNGLLTTLAIKTTNKTYYALEGSTYIAGAAVQWLRDNIQIIKKSTDVEELAEKVSDEDIEDLYFLPFFTGLGTPHWKSEAKAAILGMTRSTNKNHISRAVLEGIALSVNDAFEVFTNESPYPITSLKVDGGASLNDLLMRMQSSFINKEVVRPPVVETTGLGAAIGCKILLDNMKLEDIHSLYKKDKAFFQETSEYHQKKKSGWKDYIKKNFC